MTTLHPALVFLGGLIVLVFGAEILLRGAARMATLLGLSPVIIGLTIVSIGTSAPELAVGIMAASENKGSLAVGNIAGTNILNILFILGLSAAIRPLPIHLQSVRVEVPVMIGSALALIAMSLDGVLSRTEGILLVFAAVLYTVVLVRSGRRESADVKQEFSDELSEEFGPAVEPQGQGRRAAGFVWQVLLLTGGIALTVLGANWLVNGAVDIARSYHVSDAFIGLTIVAIGTSAPELVTTIVSTVRNDRDVAIGNLIGSSIYNILFILGLTMVISPRPIEVAGDVLWIDLPLAAIVAVACLPVLRSDWRVSRREGIGFVLLYLAYLGSLLVFRS